MGAVDTAPCLSVETASPTDVDKKGAVSNLGISSVGDKWRIVRTLCAFAFATVSVAGARPIGMTRYMVLRPDDRGLEIGSTWLTRAAWNTGANVEAKLLQLGYAFETLGCIRVELKTHAANERSRGAMERLGATFEGIHRKHRIVPGLGVRDTAWYSVLDDEWPAVRDGLLARLHA